jgi:hypothetical protein
VYSGITMYKEYEGSGDVGDVEIGTGVVRLETVRHSFFSSDLVVLLTCLRLLLFSYCHVSVTVDVETPI